LLKSVPGLIKSVSSYLPFAWAQLLTAAQAFF
jgi:hypothetical protein